MLRYIYGSDLARFPRLEESMFLDRADQFKHRLGWEVTLDTKGWERDEYDDLNPLYVIWENPDGTHGGSMRFLPTVGRTMVNDHFGNLTGGGPICDPGIWECTRFCLSPKSESRIAAALMLGGGELMRHFKLAQFAGVFDARMVRIYRMIGSSPVVLGESGTGRGKISLGLWSYSPQAHLRVAQSAGVSLALSEKWFQRSFGAVELLLSA